MGAVSFPPYTFEYLTPEKLPRRTSLMQSKWGYATDSYVKRENVPTATGYMEVIKAVNPSWIGFPEYGLLTKITYPTGGYRMFQFERNYLNAGVSINKVNDYNFYNNKSVETSYTYDSDDYLYGLIFQSYQSFNVGSRVSKYEVLSSFDLKKNELFKGQFVVHKDVKVSRRNPSQIAPSDFEVFIYSNAALETGSSVENSTVYTIPAQKYSPNPLSNEYEERSQFENIFPYPQNTSFGYRRGLLNEHLFYKTNGEEEPRLVKHVINSYQFKDVPEVSGTIYGLQGGLFVL